ncbi:TerD family protein [Streptomyces sp. NPDC005438]|uniref:TerD family protein n=1 Tax=Streptomyces sp. NPDC005438 TaxID=3156880 RepID=UPI0033BB376B
MTRAMTKGSNTALPVTAVRAVLRWSGGADAPDVDASALLLGADERVRSDDDFIFYNQPRHPSGLVRHLAKTSDGGTIRDSVEADLHALESSVARVMLVASCDGGTFAQVRDAVLLVHDSERLDEPPLLEFPISPETGGETAMLCGEFYRRGDTWKFRALSQGYDSGLVGLATEFGISVDEGEGSDDGAPEPDASDTVTAPAGAGGPGPSEPTPVGPATVGPGLVVAETGEYHLPAPMPQPQTAADASVPPPPGEPRIPEPEPIPAPPPEPGPPSPEPTPPSEPLPSGAFVAANQPTQPAQMYVPPPQQPPATQPAYGYPQPAYGYPQHPDPSFQLPPQGPQFMRR